MKFTAHYARSELDIILILSTNTFRIKRGLDSPEILDNEVLPLILSYRNANQLTSARTEYMELMTPDLADLNERIWIRLFSSMYQVCFQKVSSFHMIAQATSRVGQIKNRRYLFVTINSSYCNINEILKPHRESACLWRFWMIVMHMRMNSRIEP